MPNQRTRPWLLLSLSLGVAILVCGTRSGNGATPERASLSAGRAQARVELQKRNVPFTAEVFVRKAAEGDIESVKRFLEAGMSPDATNQLGYTGLMWASGQGREVVVRELLERGANVNARARDGSTALTAAASEDQRKVAEILLARGADLNAPHDGRGLPLIAAVRENHLQMAEFLLPKGANIEARDDEGYTALFYAAHNAASEDANGATVPMVKLLLSKKADANATAPNGSTPLMSAAAKGEAEIVQLLGKAGARIDATDQKGKTALLRGVEEGASPEVARILVSLGARIDVQDAAGETALMKSCRRKRAGMAQALIQAKANLNLQDKDGNDALMIAAAYGNSAIVDALLKAGADPKQTNKKGQTAYVIARDQHTAAVDRLKPQSQ